VLTVVLSGAVRTVNKCTMLVNCPIWQQHACPCACRAIGHMPDRPQGQLAQHDMEYNTADTDHIKLCTCVLQSAPLESCPGTGATDCKELSLQKPSTVTSAI